LWPWRRRGADGSREIRLASSVAISASGVKEGAVWWSAARCRINKDTEEKKQEQGVEAHCLKTQDTVVHGKNHEPIDSRRIP
jgi:hypothetical protein